MKSSLSRLFLLLFIFLYQLAQAAIIEDITEIKVPVKGAFGTSMEKVIVTIWHDETKTNTPFVLINHGRSPLPTEREKFGRGRYANESKALVKLGFTVLVPTRIGYGVSAGPDVEYSAKAYGAANSLPIFEIMAQQGMEVIKLAQSLPYVNPNNGMLVGISHGGAMVLAIGAKNLPCIKAILNLAGGAGGDPIKNPGRPVGAQDTETIFRTYGQTTTVPTAWIYAKSDEYWGSLIPLNWYRAFAEGGSPAKLYHLEDSTAGHSVFRKEFETWFTIFKAMAKENNVI